MQNLKGHGNVITLRSGKELKGASEKNSSEKT